MNIEKLLALLSDQALFMCRLDRLRDRWEGVWPAAIVESVRQNWGDQAESFLDMSRMLKRAFYVSCWHASAHESAALWGVYGSQAGIAVKSTVSRLKTAVGSSPDPVYLGAVRYCDFSRDELPGDFNMLTPPFVKRKSFEHEQEVRLLAWKMPTVDPHSGETKQIRPPAIRAEEDDSSVAGRQLDWERAESHETLPVNLSNLVEAVYLSPTAPNWLRPHLEKLLDRFSLSDTPVVASDLYAEHVY